MFNPAVFLQMRVPAKHYRLNFHRYNPEPDRWKYPHGLHVKRLNPRGVFPRTTTVTLSVRHRPKKWVSQDLTVEDALMPRERR